MEIFGIIVPAALLDIAVLALIIRRCDSGKPQGWGTPIFIAFWSAAIMYYTTGAAIALAQNSSFIASTAICFALSLAGAFIVICARYLTDLGLRNGVQIAARFAIYKILVLAVLYVRHHSIIHT